MKKINLLLLYVCITTLSFGQVDSIKVTPLGLTETQFKVNAEPNIIYARTLNWVNETFKNPEKVLVGKVDGSSVTISGYAENAYRFNSLGMPFFYDISYHLYITITGNLINYKMVIDQVHGQGGIASPEVSIYNAFFKKTGEPRSMYDLSRNTLKGTINALLFTYYNAFNNMDLTSDEAINLLKKYKEKLDLQLISQEEYDKKKIELLKYIK